MSPPWRFEPRAQPVAWIKSSFRMSHCPLGLWPKVTNFNKVRASVVSNNLAKTVSKSVHQFGWNFVHKKSGHTDRHTHRHTDIQTHTQTNWSENITYPRFRGVVESSWEYVIRTRFVVPHLKHSTFLFNLGSRWLLKVYWFSWYVAEEGQPPQVPSETTEEVWRGRLYQFTFKKQPSGGTIAALPSVQTSPERSVSNWTSGQ